MSLDEERISELRATAHPLRLQMLSLLTGAELSAAEVARELDVTQANASYHLRLLHDAGLLVIASEETVRGGRAKRYRHPWDAPTARPAAHREIDRQADVRVLSDMIPRRFEQRARGERSRFTDAELWVEPEVWERVVALLDEASGLLHEQARPPRTAGTVRAALSVAAFRLEGGAGS
ncbi:MAG: helix-turn-helix domain-containing protein [Humibacillus sp.]